MSEFWMVRAGEGGYLFEDFIDKNAVTIGFNSDVDLTPAKSKADVKEILRKANHVVSNNALAILAKFRCSMSKGDRVLSYDPSSREYSLGTIDGDYLYKKNFMRDHSHVRRVKWEDAKIPRDALTTGARNTLGSTLTLFEPGQEVEREVMKLISNGIPSELKIEAETERLQELDTIKDDIVEKSKEFIKDRIAKLTWEKMQELVAAILRAMGYKTRISALGSDRGKDIVASPDGLGLSPPRIKIEVKHRPQTTMGAPEIRAFIGGLRADDRGLYVSTGGFTKEAHYEAERANIPINLIDLEVLASLLIQHYEGLDIDGKALVPLTRVYWPAQT